MYKNKIEKEKINIPMNIQKRKKFPHDCSEKVSLEE